MTARLATAVGIGNRGQVVRRPETGSVPFKAGAPPVRTVRVLAHFPIAGRNYSSSKFTGRPAKRHSRWNASYSVPCQRHHWQKFC